MDNHTHKYLLLESQSRPNRFQASDIIHATKLYPMTSPAPMQVMMKKRLFSFSAYASNAWRALRALRVYIVMSSMYDGNTN